MFFLLAEVLCCYRESGSPGLRTHWLWVGNDQVDQCALRFSSLKLPVMLQRLVQLTGPFEQYCPGLLHTRSQWVSIILYFLCGVEWRGVKSPQGWKIKYIRLWMKCHNSANHHDDHSFLQIVRGKSESSKENCPECRASGKSFDACLFLVAEPSFHYR